MAAPSPTVISSMKEPGELDDPVLGAPGMAIARADLETQTLIEASGFVEVADGNDEMIDPAGHRALSCDESIDLGRKSGLANMCSCRPPSHKSLLARDLSSACRELGDPPPPCGEELEVGVWRQSLIGYRPHPHPDPPHKGEGNNAILS